LPLFKDNFIYRSSKSQMNRYYKD